VAEIQASVENPTSQTPVHVRNEPASLTLEYRGQVREADFASFLDVAYPALYAMLGRLGIPPAGPSAALYPPAVEELEEVVAYVPIATGAQTYPSQREGRAAAPPLLPDNRGPVALGEVPAATVAVLTHHGGYDTIADTYQLLGRWVAEHKASAEMQVREVYIVGPTQADDPMLYRTDICWPLVASGTHTQGGLS